VFVEADGHVAFVARDRELVRDRGPLAGQAVTQSFRWGALLVVLGWTDQAAHGIDDRSVRFFLFFDGSRTRALTDDAHHLHGEGLLLRRETRKIGLFFGDHGRAFAAGAATGGFFFLRGGHERLRFLRSVAINGHGLEAELPGLDVGVHDVLDRHRFGQVDGLRYCAWY